MALGAAELVQHLLLRMLLCACAHFACFFCFDVCQVQVCVTC